ncbi:MAG: ATP-binding protein [Desulfuromonadaceae bacterium]|nr:ATP-binding protein [Desulfuromonadaceae bacterium]
MNNNEKLYPRQITAKVEDALLDTPVVFICGPRQSGKTTLVRQFTNEKRPYLTLDDQTTLLAARHDPVGLIRSFPNAVIDEVQRAPELLLAIKRAVDEGRRPGRFLLTGSANIMVLPSVADSLAGRMEILPLLPLAQSEIEGCRTNCLDALFCGDIPRISSDGSGVTLHQRVLAGGYPEVLTRPTARRRTAWGKHYVDALIQRDVRDIAAIDKVEHLPRLLRCISQVAGQLCNYSQLGGQIGMDHKTTQKYLAVFEQMYLLKRLEVWSGNHLNRLVKAPKVQFLDSGLLSILLNLSEIILPQDGKVFGRVLETFVYGEILKQIAWAEGDYRLMYYRDKDKYEVDFVLENQAGTLIGIELKAAASVSKSDLSGLRRFRQVAREAFQLGIVMYDGTETLPLGDGFWAVPIGILWGVKG